MIDRNLCLSQDDITKIVLTLTIVRILAELSKVQRMSNDQPKTEDYGAKSITASYSSFNQPITNLMELIACNWSVHNC